MKKELITIGDKTYKGAQVIYLPTKERTEIWKRGYDNLFDYIKESKIWLENGECQHLYIVSSEKIKQDDYFLYKNVKGSYTVDKAATKDHADGHNKYGGAFKIIASTDTQTRIGTPTPRPSSDFIKKFCELNGEIKDVLVEYEYNKLYPMVQNNNIQLKVAPDNTISIIKKEENSDDNWNMIRRDMGRGYDFGDDGDILNFVMKNYKLMKI